MQGPRTMAGALLGFGLLLGAGAPLAGPPFMTDDPEPVEYRHSEAYVFSTFDRGARGNKSYAAPAFEFNTSPSPDWHLHALLPFTGARPDHGPDAYGLGDVELGVKYRFLHETDTRPQAGFFPMLYMPTGDADRGLGNDRVWGTFPLWLQKNFGPWTTYGGGGRAWNSAPGMRNYGFEGWLLQREITERLTLGAELFHQGAPSADAGRTTFFNVGGFYNAIAACGGCSLLFRVGTTVAGEHHYGGYLGLYWNFGSSGDGAPASPILQSSPQPR